MTKNEFRQALRRNRISCDEFAALTGRSIKTIYEFGERSPVPYYARVILRMIDERGGADGLIPRGAPENTECCYGKR